MSRFFIFPVTILFFFLAVSCHRASDYQKRVKSELATGKRSDTLFLGIYFGMTQDSFLKQCTMLNHQERIREGVASLSVQFELKGRNALRNPAAMNFFPEFKAQKIVQMPLSFSYANWAPWNQSTSPDSLLVDVLGMMEKWYGKGFIKEGNPKRGYVYVKVDGNRQIVISKNDELKVVGMMTDLTVNPPKF